jgi:hypothetical protein
MWQQGKQTNSCHPDLKECLTATLYNTGLNSGDFIVFVCVDYENFTDSVRSHTFSWADFICDVGKIHKFVTTRKIRLGDWQTYS